MKRVTLRQLRVFEQVARLRSISAAAGVCHLTQPAVSMQLKALEQEIAALHVSTLTQSIDDAICRCAAWLSVCRCER